VTGYPHITAEVDRSRGGRTTAAFFDFDGTLIAGYSVSSFIQRRALSGDMPPREMIGQLMSAWQYGLNLAHFSDILVGSAKNLRGISDRMMREISLEVYEKDLSASIYPESRALVDAHLARGHTVVIVSSATQYQVEHVAKELGIEHVLCTQLEVVDGALTGDVLPPVCYGESKRDVALRFAEEHGLNMGNSYFYTDGAEDIPLLEAVGHPRPINPDGNLAGKSRREGWPALKFSSRGLPGITDFIRTGLVYGSLVGSFLTGVPAYLLNNSKRDLVNVAVPMWGDFGTAVAGLDITTEGEEHLWSHRPAVFLFNHQSKTDAMILARLLRRDFTGVAKQELKSNPIVGPVLDAVGTVFIDRGSHDKAVEALRPAVDSLKNGTSFVMAPEGQRSRGYRLGEFKLGPFHIAMQAGVPIVPIVIQNSSDSMPKNGIFIRPAEISVKVLPPVATDNWKAETVHQHADEVRGMFLRELGQHREKSAQLRRVK
jgi:putative phosphoserine phosphatase/1-acylglycerol-3-phosphate O-acyltransferase